MSIRFKLTILIFLVATSNAFGVEDRPGWRDHFGTYAVEESKSRSAFLIIQELGLSSPPTIVLHPRKENSMCANGWTGERHYGELEINGHSVPYSQSCMGVVMLSYPSTDLGLRVLINELLNNESVEINDGGKVLQFSSEGFPEAYEELMR